MPIAMDDPPRGVPPIQTEPAPSDHRLHLEEDGQLAMDPSPAEHERTWFRLHDALPSGWRAGPASYHPARHCWTVAAWSPVGGRRHPPEETLIGSGVDELAAVTDLAMTLEERPRTEAFEEIERRGRLAYLAGAEAESRRPGRPLTDAELERVTGRSPRG